MTSVTPKQQQQHSKATAATVFVRFVPPSTEIRRHHLEDAFSHVGPIRKSAVIHSTTESSKSYAFVKYTKQEDADLAAQKLHNQKIRVGANEIQLRVELASAEPHKREKRKANPDENREDSIENDEDFRKKHCRVIVRNLSFYAKESQIRKALSEQFGPIHDVHLPTVQNQHRGFCFVTFETKAAAAKCVAAKRIEIAKRISEIAWSLSKQAFEANKSQKKKPKIVKEIQQKQHDRKEMDLDESEDCENEQKEGSEVEEDENGTDSDREDGVGIEEAEQQNSNADKSGSDEKATEKEIRENRSLFIRNLPFDATRHDLFEVFRHFGRISGIYLVKDKGVFKGSAFLVYDNAKAAEKALQRAGGDSSFTPLKESELGSGILALKGRPLRVNLAVDKGTASTFEQQQTLRADRRHLYLQAVGRVEDDWENLPETDRQKRQAAWSEKQTKLRSPLFFINPTRLSIRNIAKHIDETSLKELIAKATERGLARVKVEDAIAHMKALGDKNPRDIISTVEKSEDSIIPPFDPNNIRKFIPSVFINRDFVASKKTADVKPPSRGFGFAEFQHHVHALACLRELNNNTHYSADYAAGGKQASISRKSTKRKVVGEEGPTKIPRLIVEFTVENTVKAKQQAEHRAAQLANKFQQKTFSKTKDEKKTKKSRGAKQREKKRHVKEDVGNDNSDLITVQQSEEPLDAVVEASKNGNAFGMKIDDNKTKVSKVTKRRRINREEEKLRDLVDNHTGKRKNTPSTDGVEMESGYGKAVHRRWFE